MAHSKHRYHPHEELEFIRGLREPSLSCYIELMQRTDGPCYRAVDAAGKPLDAGLREMFLREARRRRAALLM